MVPPLERLERLSLRSFAFEQLDIGQLEQRLPNLQIEVKRSRSGAAPSPEELAGEWHAPDVVGAEAVEGNEEAGFPPVGHGNEAASS